MSDRTVQRPTIRESVRPAADLGRPAAPEPVVSESAPPGVVGHWSDAPDAVSAAFEASAPGERRAATPRPSTAVLAWLRLARVYQKVHQRSTDEMRDRGLSLGQFDVLAQVGANEGATQQEVADALLVTKSNVCQLLDRMEEAGLVERRQQGRAKRLYLTAEGQRLYDCVVPAHERRIEELLGALPVDEQTQLLGLLRTLDRALS